MPEYVFEPQVDEEELVRRPAARLWPMWVSAPYREPVVSFQRKRLLLVAEVMRTVEDQLIDLRCRAVIGVAETYADGLISRKEMQKAHDDVIQAYESAPTRPGDGRRHVGRRLDR